MSQDTATPRSTADAQHTDHHRLSRRQLIGAGVTTLAAGLAGCSSDSGSDSGSPTTAVSTGVIKSVQVSGKNLEIRIQEEAAPLDIHLLNEDGKQVKVWGLDAGTLLEINLVRFDYDDVWRYTPGHEYKIVAYDSEEKVGEAEFAAAPDLSITDVYLDDSYGRAGWRIGVEITNAGSGPTLMSDAGFVSESEWMESSPISTEDGIGQNTTSNRVVIPADGKNTIRLADSPFPPNRETDRCGEGRCRVTVEDMTGTRLSVETTFSLKQTDDDPVCDDVVFGELEQIEPPQKTTSRE